MSNFKITFKLDPPSKKPSTRRVSLNHEDPTAKKEFTPNPKIPTQSAPNGNFPETPNQTKPPSTKEASSKTLKNKSRSSKRSNTSYSRNDPAAAIRDLKASINRMNSTFKPNESGKNIWEYRWIKISNAIDFAEEIWMPKWVKLIDPKEKGVQKKPPVVKKEVKVYKCKFDNCGKTFQDQASLKKHMVTHGERQFVCPVDSCGKKFLDKSKLRRHQLVHTGERPYKCEICGKKFSLDFNLRTHIRTHTGSKPYICSYPSSPGCAVTRRLWQTIHSIFEFGGT